MCLKESVTQNMPKMTQLTKKKIHLFILIAWKYGKRGADMSVSRKMFAHQRRFHRKK